MRNRLLFFLVFVWHLALLVFISKNNLYSKVDKQKNKPLIVRTIRLKPSSPALVRPKAKKVMKKKPKKAKKSSPKKSKRGEKLQEILKKVKENIAKIEETPGKMFQISSEVKVPSPIKIDVDKRARYLSILTCHLENLLKFPEHGDVKVELALRFDGSVENVDVTESKSRINHEYVISTLPGMQMPPFGGSFKERIKTFSILLNTRL